jgi:glycosyltransferase involved in cell wall biosynthesis
LQQVARKAGVENRLILPGPQPYDRIPLYFCAADASVLASYREGCPNVVLESLACGTPVVASDVGAVADVLPVPSAGRIAPPQTIAPLQQAMNDILSRSWDAEQVVRASGVRTWDEVATQVHDVLRQVVEEGKAKD